ncbi:FAD-dependent monooxygenase [Streptomyces sp. NPDC057445]|uniref:FAD-dependent monooxygenase n=1 Tax=Streptomyces sp. NPDC057445 TaxID=3346136 RepID=UPI0036C7A208
MGVPCHAQVLVVGGGPVGMLVAAELAGRGVDTLVLEREAATSERPKATTLHARTAQCLARRGYLFGPRRRASGDAVTMPFHFAGMTGLSITAPAAEPDPIIKVAQVEVERLFEARALAAGARVLRGRRVTDVQAAREGVRVVATATGGRETFTADYLVGADGARSTVREQAGFVSDTHPATVSAIMGVVRLGDRDAVREGWHRTPRGWIVAKDGPDGTTHLRTLICDRPPADRRLPPTVEEFSREASRIAARHVGMSAPRWLSRFSDFTRLVRAYRADRVFLAGDAAHVHFPIGGQGLSTGLLDALNLGWKLALAVRGRAGEGLLDTYDSERRPAAQRVIDNTRAQVALMRPDPVLDPVRTLLGGMLTSEGVNDCLSAMISGQETVIAPFAEHSSPWDGTFLPNAVLSTPQGPTGVTELLQEGRPLLLVQGDQGSGYAREARGWSDVLRVVHCVPTGALPCAALLVRPDGYIGWASDGGTMDTALTAYFGGARRIAPAV